MNKVSLSILEELGDTIFMVGPMISTGEYLVVLRKRNSLTQEELAGIAGVAKGTIVSAENDRGSVRLSSIIKIYLAFGLSLSPQLEPNTKGETDESIRSDK